MAEQLQPVKRRVALKIIKAGMDSKQVIARFEAERQALAMMDHPNIARLLDVGTTESGQPFFVMELVKGIPLTSYCDEKHLKVKQRLELFTSVCDAVQHAHQKGVIHRDLKPNNILVAEYDSRVVPKIIDFGLAKALHHNLTDRTMFTQLGQVVGTLAYMSPEQSKMNQLEVDTRTDIYSLGVLLYELLTGTTPFEPKRLKSAAIDQVLKMIREEEPPKPSTRLSTVATKPEIATNRGVESKKLSGLIRGDLDWIVMKALDKERSRRYETASGFAEDVQRHMTGEPIVAAPPSTSYRIQKFVKRNRVAVAVASLTAAILIAGIFGTTTGMFWAINEKSRADDQAELASLATAAEREAKQQALTSAKQALNEKANAQAARKAAEYLQYVSNIQASNLYVENKSANPARNILRNTPPEYRNWEWAYVANIAWRQHLRNPVSMTSNNKEQSSSAEPAHR